MLMTVNDTTSDGQSGKQKRQASRPALIWRNLKLLAFALLRGLFSLGSFFRLGRLWLLLSRLSLFFSRSGFLALTTLFSHATFGGRRFRSGWKRSRAFDAQFERRVHIM